MKLLNIMLIFCLAAYLCAGRSIRDRFEIGVISTPSEAAQILRTTWDDDITTTESFVVILLDDGNRLVDTLTIEKGNSFTVPISSEQIESVAGMAYSMIIAHNHPSPGDAQPSDADIRFTHHWGAKLGARLIDHIILPASDQDQYFSFVENGRLDDNY